MSYWLSLEKVLVVWDMLKTGKSVRQIERETGVNRNTICTFRNRLLKIARERRIKACNEETNHKRSLPL